MEDQHSLRAEALSRYAGGDLQGALTIYRRLCAACPHDAELLNDMGTICFELGQLAESKRCVLAALAADPQHEEARGRIVLQINSDTILSRPALEQHYAEHEKQGFDPLCVVVGGRKFPDAHLSSLFNYLHEAVPLYTPLHRLRPGFRADYTWFVTCNLSCLREAYERFGTYDPAFPWGSDQELGRRWEEGHGVRIYVHPHIVSYHLHWLSFDQWKRKIQSVVPFWFRRNMGMDIEELPLAGREAARRKLAALTISPEAVEADVRRLEAWFQGPDRYRPQTVMGRTAWTLHDFVWAMRKLLHGYRDYLQCREICRHLDAAEVTRTGSGQAVGSPGTGRPGAG